MTVPEDEKSVVGRPFSFLYNRAFLCIVSLPLACMVWRVLMCMSFYFSLRVRVFSVLYECVYVMFSVP